MTNLANLLFSGPTWIVLGLVLIGLELVVPGAVIVFFGVGAILTGVLTMAEVLPGLQAQLLTWVLSSLVLVLLFRRKIAQWFPAFERYDPRPEDQEILGRHVEVIEDILPDSKGGLVRLQGANWQAATAQTPIYSGSEAKIVGRKNLLLIVEPVSAGSESDAEAQGPSGGPPDSFGSSPASNAPGSSSGPYS